MARSELVISGLIGVTLALLFLWYLSPMLYGGDAGDFASAVATRGIPHPPGYPLYTTLGILFSFLPWGTLSWKIGMISVLSSSGAAMLWYLLLRLITRSSFWPVLGVLSLVFTYPYWLYSEVVEVFALNNLLFVLLVFLLFLWQQRPRVTYLFLASFFLGLSFSHHHTAVFLLPMLIVLLFSQKRAFLREMTKRAGVICCLLFICGLIPYGYFLVAARQHPDINWMGTPTAVHLVRQVTRAEYGPFRLAATIGNQPLLRFSEIAAFFSLLYRDFRLAGCLLMGIGCISLWRTKRNIFIPVAVGGISYLFFYFYAAFPLLTEFMLGVFERFVFPLYFFATIFLVFGCIQIQRWVERVVFLFSAPDSSSGTVRPAGILLRYGMMGAFLLYPLGLFLLNQPKIQLVQRDQTVQRLGEDILNSVPAGSVVLVGTDTPLFASQYAYYVLHQRPDIRLIRVAQLYTHDALEDLQRQYSDLIIPSHLAADEDVLEKFLKENSGHHPIFLSVRQNVADPAWIPWGIVYRYAPPGADIPIETVMQENTRLWAVYQNPVAGVLSHYRPLLIADVIPIYALSHRQLGAYLGAHKQWQQAQVHLEQSLLLDPTDPETSSVLTQVSIALQQCDKAASSISVRKKLVPDDPLNFFLLSLHADACLHDERAAQQYLGAYQQAMKERQANLKQVL